MLGLNNSRLSVSVPMYEQISYLPTGLTPIALFENLNTAFTVLQA